MIERSTTITISMEACSLIIVLLIAVTPHAPLKVSVISPPLLLPLSLHKRRSHAGVETRNMQRTVTAISLHHFSNVQNIHCSAWHNVTISFLQSCV